MMKPRSSYSKTAFILLFSVFLVAAVTKAKSSLPDITLEQAKEINADNTVIFLFHHGERCDRSDMPCYSDKSGITITGTEKAQQEGIKFATIFSEYDIYSSNAVRTIQTAKFFSGKEPVVMDSLSDCNNDLYKTLESIARESHKRNIVIMTHNHCLSFLARDRLGKKFKPAYLDALIMHYDGTRLILDGKYNKEA
ncbi:TPA: histidine phosphatase family protein [Escherichia coli]|uniref:Histidine phosphatase family protein n=1 Tax=Salmonella typhimurium TaxID=90371 RepID=A0A734G6C4_SALTM|nr:histidine phosphatase family protein [Escherichia coli]EBL7894958.1 histidine phosphatase family protein [Salmonella enterica]ECR6087361.1 histidine phosphatase family protein [Salmonella enterica subsp. enterica serovar Kentucky]HAE6228128.1 histidine phosphatase family protein [Salmonella enterica subsp. enterica serovar Typhimurium]EEB5360803.1 lipopolysaccharide core heptose(II)-phosphate phosphatase [Salmonella enterica subsp. enterica serovar Kentucky]EEN3339927.1 lipopolysaccharide c